MSYLLWQFDVNVGGGGLILVRRKTGDVRHRVLLGRLVSRRGRRGVGRLGGAVVDGFRDRIRRLGGQRVQPG